MGDPIEVPSGCAPRRAAFSSARQESWCSSDALARARLAPRCEADPLTRPSSMSRQRHRIPPRQGAFHRRMPARRRAFTRNLERGPATGCRLCRRGPASDALSPRCPVRGVEARPVRFRGLITHVRFRPCAVRRLLPSFAIRKHGRRTFDTRLRRMNPAFTDLVIARVVCGGPPCTPA